MNRSELLTAVATMLGAAAIPIPARAVLRSPFVVTNHYPDLNLGSCITLPPNAVRWIWSCSNGVWIITDRADLNLGGATLLGYAATDADHVVGVCYLRSAASMAWPRMFVERTGP
jgi:hypothetical protein